MILHPRISKISQFIDGNLDDLARIKLEAHLAKCEACRKKVELLTRASTLVDIPKSKIDQLSDQVMGKLEAGTWDSSSPIIGEIEAVVGMVLVWKKGEGEAVLGFPGMALRKGDTVVTEEDSRALLRLNDGSHLYVNKETNLDFEFGKYSLKMSLGEIFVMMKPQKSNFHIGTPSAVLSVIGTKFDTKVTEQKQTILQVLKGSVFFRNDSGGVIVKKSQQVEAARETQPVPVKMADIRPISTWTGSIKPRESKFKGGWIMKKIIMGIIGIFILGAVVVGGYSLYDEYFNYKPTPITTTSSSSTSTDNASSLPSTGSQSEIPIEKTPDLPSEVQDTKSTANLPNDQTMVSRPVPHLGSRIFMQLEQITKASTTMPGNPRPVESRSKAIQKMSLSDMEQQADGSYRKELKFLTMSMVNEEPGGTTSVSSESDPPKDQKALPLWNMVKAMSDVALDIYVDKNQEVIKIAGVQKILERIKATCPPQVVQSMEASMNEESMTESMKIFGRVLPDYAVKVGDEWNFTSKMNLPMVGKMASDMKYKFIQWDNYMERSCIVLGINGTMSSKGGATPTIMGAMGAKFNKLDGKIAGKVWYEPATGITLYTTLTQSIDMGMTLQMRDRKGFREENINLRMTSIINTQFLGEEKIQ